MILSITELQDNIQKEINTLYGTGATTEIPHKPNKIQLLREYFKLCGNIVRMRHEIKSAKDNVARTKRKISETRVWPGYFVEPYWDKWGNKYPCTLVHLRHGMEDMYTGEVFNFGDQNDAKTFCCPYFSWDKKCTGRASCDYKVANTEYIDAKHALGDAITAYNDARAQRKELRTQIFTRNK